MSDHAYFTTKYMTKEQIYTPKFISLRDNWQLTKQNLKICIDLNQNFKNIVKFNHPNDMANSLQIELNTIINTIGTGGSNKSLLSESEGRKIGMSGIG